MSYELDSRHPKIFNMRIKLKTHTFTLCNRIGLFYYYLLSMRTTLHCIEFNVTQTHYVYITCSIYSIDNLPITLFCQVSLVK